MDYPASPTTYVRANGQRFVAELAAFIRHRSVSAQPQHAGDTARCAAWLAEHLGKIGLENVRAIPTRRHPIVYANWLHAPGRPTVLIYGHYDVQPAEPLAAWRSPPFEPVILGNHIYGRGASDNKGQMFAHVKALEAYLKTSGKLPVNVICLFEGEEEIGSPSLAATLRRFPKAFAADLAVVSDTQIPAANRPAVTYSLRGSLSVELDVRGQAKDLHSGLYGGAVHNPVQALCEMLAKLHDEQGRVAIPGFYDRVRQWDGRERDYMRKAGPTDQQILSAAGAETAWGELGYTLYERTTIRPALTLCGIVGGYQGAGVKAAIPAGATAKLNFRLAANQDPLDIERLLRSFISAIAPPGIHARIKTVMRDKPALINREHPAVCAAAQAYSSAFGTPAIFLRNGGTIPVVNLIQETLGIPAALMGFGLPDDNIHGPNERFHLPTFVKCIDTSLGFLAKLDAPASQFADQKPACSKAPMPQGNTRNHRSFI
jgi:acetylornithine deacetylase/succinyl-diaminopimelate desuccinylase-like protein